MAKSYRFLFSSRRDTPRGRNLLGVNAGPARYEGGKVETNEAVLEAYRTIGVRAVRTHDFEGPFDMAWFYPTEKKGGWDLTAKALHAIVDNGFEPYLRLGYSYQNAQRNQEVFEELAASGSARRNWCRAAADYVKRCLDAADGKLRCIEIWNEPDGTRFWAHEDDDKKKDEKEAYRSFAKLFEMVVLELRERFGEDLAIGGPGMTHYANDEDGRNFSEIFLKEIGDSEAKGQVDFISWHCYLNDPNLGKDEYEDVAPKYLEKEHERFARDMRRKFDGDRPFHLTEWNLANSYYDKLSTALGATKLTATWIAMHRLGFGRAFFYRGDGNPNAEDAKAPKGPALVTADGQIRHAGHAFRLWSRFWDVACGDGGVLAEVECYEDGQKEKKAKDRSNKGLWGLAACNRDETAFLVANDTGKDVRYALDLEERFTEPGVTTEVECIESDGVTAGRPKGEWVSLPQGSTHLLVVSRATQGTASRRRGGTTTSRGRGGETEDRPKTASGRRRGASRRVRTRT